MNKAVILLSGGLDSSTCLAIASAKGYACYALSFDYGQKQRAELKAATAIAKNFQVKRHEIIKLSIGNFGGSALTDSNLAVPEHQESTAIPITYVPARNTIMLAIALGFAEIVDAAKIFIGVSAIDYSNYPDCRPEYIQAFNEMARLGTKKGDEGQVITIETPLIHLTKAETIQLGLTHGVDYSATVSCYNLNDERLACGKCSSCFLRKKGFAEAGIADPTRYVINKQA